MQRIINFHQNLNQLIIYIKNVILFKSNQSSKRVAHIRSFQGIVERKIDGIKLCERFFNTDKTYFKSILDYMVACGEISNLGNGYYMALTKRDIVLPISDVVISVGTSSDLYNNRSYYGVFVENDKSIIPIELKDYRYDHTFDKWLTLFRTSADIPYLKNEEYYKPTSTGYKNITKNNLQENKLYYCVSNPVDNKREYYILYKKKDTLYGTFINNHLLKGKLSLLLGEGYIPQYRVNLISKENKLYKITLSDVLPNIERELIYLFSIPKKLNFSKEYYVHKKFIRDFIFILQQLNYRRKDSD